MKNIPWHIVDVRDVVDALLLVYEKEKSARRYICAPNCISAIDLVNMLKKAHPNYNYVNWWISYHTSMGRILMDSCYFTWFISLCCSGNDLVPNSIVTPLMSVKLKNLGWKPSKTLEETLLDSVESYEKMGLLQDVEGCPCRLPHLFHMAIEKWRKLSIASSVT